ncbi:nascent polypeptide-associated complex subunit alpha, muscle-specific form-like [Cydia splendana]|uniref:nascent polypeptide-associated complex subunit alpha, muscle-specific form-like n=1 Tax=Cydia splendana TaxID=1100963 RepID=UPI00300DB052
MGSEVAAAPNAEEQEAASTTLMSNEHDDRRAEVDCCSSNDSGQGRLWRGRDLGGQGSDTEVAGLRRSPTTHSQRDRTISGSVLPDAPENLPAAELSQRVQKSLETIALVAKRSGNLKGTCVRALNDAAVVIKDAFECLVERTSSEETRRLQAQNNSLRIQLTEVMAEVAQLRADFREQFRRVSPGPSQRTEKTQPTTSSRKGAAASSDMEDMMSTMTAQVGLALDARLRALELEGRLLPARPMRPPLAADLGSGSERDPPLTRELETAPETKKPKGKRTKKTPVTATAGSSGKKVIDATKKPQPAPAPQPRAKKTAKTPAKKKGGTGTQSANEVSTPRSLPPAPATMKEGWNVVARKGKKWRTAQSAARPQPTEKAKAKKLKPPRTAAVVLTLQPEALQKGVTYKEVITEARTKVQLTDMDIPGGLRFRRAATGACILEVPGVSSGDKADKLAEAIQQQIGLEKVRVSRPSKTVDIRVTGLDESVTKEEVVAAVAKTGGCTVDMVKAGEVRQGFSGLGTVWVQCPILAAKKVVAGGRLLVGWVSAQVKLLEQRPLRCFRCLANGHVRAQCQAETDRSQSCFQCGKDGHKAAQCTAPPHCVVCAAAGKPSGHRLSSKACTAPKTAGKSRKTKAADGPRAPSQSVESPAMEQAATQQEEEPMVVG